MRCSKDMYFRRYGAWLVLELQISFDLQAAHCILAFLLCMVYVLQVILEVGM